MLTHDEAELYDRQIRLWGVNAQSRIRQSKVLMLGFNGIASEVAKILVLAGIDTLTIVDDQPLQESDLTSNLFCRPSPDGDKPQYRTHNVISKLKTLNPLVKVNVDNSAVTSIKAQDFKNFDLVTLHCFLTVDETSAINDICRLNKIKFYIVLDFGFFGFMFNDLGDDFRFSYEEFNDIVKNGTVKESGEEKDPISLSDDVDDIAQDSDEEEDSRPKKRRRLHSPKRESTVKVNDNEKVNKIGQLSYVKFQDMISLKKFISSKKSSPVFIISIAMFKFYTQYKHLPRQADAQANEEDLSNLNKIIVSLKDSLNLNDAIFEKLDKGWSEYIYGSLSPVCAVVGGVAGQDMIRALSGKDFPINNTFAFDGISMNGIVEKVGISDSKSISTVVRDIVEIDD